MGDPVLWVGGWASGLACWQGELAELYPGREHRFLDAHAALAEPGALRAAAGALPEGGVVAAWSLGSLLLHLDLAEGAFPDRRAVSLSPVFDFCGEGSPWPPAALARMARRLDRDREGVLADFLALVKGNTPVTRAAEAAWRRQAEGYSRESLAAGLEALGRRRVDPDALRPGPRGHALLASSRDPVSPTPESRLGRGGWHAYPSGHLPFLEHPGLLRPLLDGKEAP